MILDTPAPVFVGSPRCVNGIRFDVRYPRRGGRIGATVDRALMQRVAEGGYRQQVVINSGYRAYSTAHGWLVNRC